MSRGGGCVVSEIQCDSVLNGYTLMETFTTYVVLYLMSGVEVWSFVVVVEKTVTDGDENVHNAQEDA